MKTLYMLLTLIFPTAAILAVEPPKLVPRPIPGLSLPTTDVANLQAPSVATEQSVPILMTNPDQARVVYIHRRSTLPAALTKDLPVNKTSSAASATMLNVRQSAVKIIPKAQVAQIVAPKS